MVLSSEIDLTQAEYYMEECFELAKKALGRTSPNPIVGAIVLDKSGMPVGKGFHQKAGMLHAEANAIKESGVKSKGGVLVTNLEPCCHYGKTPPCTELIIKSGIKRVIFSNHDPNKIGCHKGEEILKQNNIEVVTGVLEKEGAEVNKFFFKWIKTKMPWITLKQAQTLDGKIALSDGSKRWITSDDSKLEVHKLRNQFDAVLVGANTVNVDDPELTVREIDDGRNPKKVILDKDLITDPKAKVYSGSETIYLFTKEGHPSSKIRNYTSGNIEVITLPEAANGGLDLRKLFIELGKREILSVLVEGGPVLGAELVRFELLDEYILFVSPKIYGDTVKMNSIKLPVVSGNKVFSFKLFHYVPIGNDLMLILRTWG